ncbi:MAG: hypothetical protein HYT50_02475 [Candidatus Wildermuthbacteria bacterium]|nr:hypothetical protein [Candidatus Wildermuthbacteria bacterium]
MFAIAVVFFLAALASLLIGLFGDADPTFGFFLAIVFSVLSGISMLGYFSRKKPR